MAEYHISIYFSLRNLSDPDPDPDPDPNRPKSPWSGEEQPSGFGVFQVSKGLETLVPQRTEKPTAAHNPEVVGSSPAPATTKTPFSSRKAVFFSAFLQLWETSPFSGHLGDPNRDPYGSKNGPGGGISVSGSSFFFEKFLLSYSAVVRTFSMVLAASFWAAVVTWA